MFKSFNNFFRLNSANGILLVIATIFTMGVENSSLRPYYDMLLNIPVKVDRLGILMRSLLSAVGGYLLLNRVLPIH